jgi:hypothetical protein
MFFKRGGENEKERKREKGENKKILVVEIAVEVIIAAVHSGFSHKKTQINQSYGTGLLERKGGKNLVWRLLTLIHLKWIPVGPLIFFITQFDFIFKIRKNIKSNQYFLNIYKEVKTFRCFLFFEKF